MREFTKRKNFKNRIFALTMIFVMVFGLVFGTWEARAADIGWEQNATGYWYVYNTDGTYYTDEWALINGNLYYFKSDGYMASGTTTVNGISYPFTADTGISSTDWYKSGDNWYYGNSGTEWKYIKGWFHKGGNWFYLKSDGKMAVGLTSVGSDTYFFNSDGVMVNDWQEQDGYDYYFALDSYKMVTNSWVGNYYVGSDGRMLTNTWIDDTYYVGDDGKMCTNTWEGDCYLGSDGKKLTDTWLEWEGHKYYLSSGGEYCKGWNEIGGYYYYFDYDGNSSNGPNGSMKKNCWVDGCYLKSDGKMARNEFVTWEGKDYYVGDRGYCVQGQTLGIGGYYYYFDEDGAKVTNDFRDDCYYGADGKRVRNTWVTWEGKKYYIGDDWIYETGWMQLPDEGNTGIYWYYLGGDGARQTGWIRNVESGEDYYCDANGKMLTGWQDIDGARYYLEPGTDNQGKMYTGRQTINGTVYNFDLNGKLLGDNYHRYLNPYYEVTEGGIYKDGYKNTVHVPVTEKYAANVEQPIPLDYLTVNIGAEPAETVTVTVPDSIKAPAQAQTNWNDIGGIEWMWNESERNTAYAFEENRDALIKSGASDTSYMEAYYKNIAMIGDRKVSLKLSVADYAILHEGDRSPIISFATYNSNPDRTKRPGILVLNIAWIQLRYELVYEDTGELVENDTKGVTTYYDVDVHQGIAINDDTNRGIYSRGVCELSVAEVQDYGSLDGTCVYFSKNEERHEETYMYQNGFTEIFQGNTLIRTFNFQSAEATGVGGMYNDGQVVNNGHLEITKTVKGTSTDANGPIDFDFTVTLTDGKKAVVPLDAVFKCTYYSDGTAIDDAPTSIAFVNGVATGIKLSHGESIKITGLPSGLYYEVTEAANSKYATTSTDATGTIEEDKTKTASFTNTEKTTLTLQKLVAGNMGDQNQTFTFKVSINGGAEQTVELKHKQSKSLSVLAGDTYTIKEVLAAGYTVEIAGADTVNEATASGAVNSGGESVTYTNIRDMEVPPTGVESDNPPYAIMIIGALMILAGWGCTSTRRRERDF